MNSNYWSHGYWSKYWSYRYWAITVAVIIDVWHLIKRFDVTLKQSLEKEVER